MPVDPQQTAKAIKAARDPIAFGFGVGRGVLVLAVERSRSPEQLAALVKKEPGVVQVCGGTVTFDGATATFSCPKPLPNLDRLLGEWARKNRITFKCSLADAGGASTDDRSPPGTPRSATPRSATPGSRRIDGAVQRAGAAQTAPKELDEKEPAAQALKERAPEFFRLPFKIVRPDLQGAGNCHGFTLGQAGDDKPASAMIAAVEKIRMPKVCLFYKGSELWHSGRYPGDELLHYLIGVGVIRSQIGASLCGYSRRFIIPDEIDAWRAFEKRRRAEAEAAAKQPAALGAKARRNCSVMRHLLGKMVEALAGAPELRPFAQLEEEIGAYYSEIAQVEPDRVDVSLVADFGTRFRLLETQFKQLKPRTALVDDPEDYALED